VSKPRTVIRQQSLLDYMAGEQPIDKVVDDVFAEPGPFTVEHMGYGEIVLTTKNGARIVANTMYVTLMNERRRGD